MADRMPNASYHYKSQILSFTQADYSSSYWALDDEATNNKFISDNGVFTKGLSNNPADNTYFACPKSSSRMIGSNSSQIMVGGINMNTQDAGTGCYKFGVTNNGAHSEYACLVMWYKINTFAYSKISYHCSTLNVDLDYRTNYKDKLNITADKVEVCYKTSNSEIVYVTGISLLATLNSKFHSGDGFIIARSVPISGDGFIPEEEGGSSNGSVIFNSVAGNVIGSIGGTNITNTSAQIISQSIPDSAMVGNDGICAVSCMCMADGEAHWLSHKNGIYKIYQGSNPLYGMPGDKMTIKGHEFVCPAYGPFYVRMS